MKFFNFGTKKNNSVVGIDIGASSIKVVQLKKRRGVAVLETYGELSLGPYSNLEIGQATNPSAEKLTEALKDILREANVTTKRAGVSIPFASSLISVIKMPVLDDKHLASMIPIEARKYIPVPISEVTLDWFVIPNEEEMEEKNDTSAKLADSEPKKIDVLLVAIHNSTLNKYNEIVRASDLDVGFFEIEIFSAIRAIVKQSITPTMVLDMGAKDTKLYIVEYGVVKVSHVISSGSQDITQTISKSLGLSLSKAEELKRKFGAEQGVDGGAIQNSGEAVVLGLDRVFAESNRILLQYSKKYRKNVGNIVLTGGGATMKGLLSVAKKHFDIEVSISDPFSKIESPAFFEKVLKEVGPGFAVAIGLALRRLQEDT